MVVKVTWNKSNRKPYGLWLQAMWDDYNVDHVLEEVQNWSAENNCGTRMSYDMWKFKTRAEVTAFLLRWS
jgi:hypothetical protein